MPTTKRQSLEREEARQELLKILKPGDTVYSILRHVSRSGMQRVIDLQVLTTDANGKPWMRWIGMYAARAMGDRYDFNRDGIVVGGCGMDMGFHLTYNLGYVLWPTGYGCTGEGCHSNDHNNGDRDYTPHIGAIVDACPNCQDRPGKDGLGRPCKGKGLLACNDGYLISTVEHWHQDGGYALRHEWI